jgi:hypothetical protein
MNSKRLTLSSTHIVRAPLLLAAAFLALSLPLPALAVKVISEKTLPGFKFPESCAHDPVADALYVGSFGGTELKSAEKDNNGYVSKVSLDGKILEERFLPIAGVTMNKPKGIWVRRQPTMGHRYRWRVGVPYEDQERKEAGTAQRAVRE